MAKRRNLRLHFLDTICKPASGNPQPVSASLLRLELSRRAQALANAGKLVHDLSFGNHPVVLFGEDDQNRHGNFHPASYSSIRANPQWCKRFAKAHSHWKKSRTHANWRWMELDSCNSSDALLMNIFCHPAVGSESGLARDVAALLGVELTAVPTFGYKPRVPLTPGRVDATEIDLRVGSLNIEAKLTEPDFQRAAEIKLRRYRDLEAVFDLADLPRTPSGDFLAYQLIRNTLAAYAEGSSFCVLCDSRRVDLIRTWNQVVYAVRAPGFTWRLKLLTWQELATTLPPDLQHFLDQKYGIQPA